MTYSLLPRPISRPGTILADALDVRDGGTSSFARGLPPDFSGRLLMRKWWEWDYLSGCVDALGLARPEATALGLGCGNEPLIFHFANQFGRVVATDLYSADTAWKEARTASIASIYESSPLPFDRERVEIRNCDMRTLDAADDSIDFIWSTSSVEHVDGLEDLWQVYAEIWRVLKPGGYAAITTEFCLTEPPYLLPGVNAMDPSLLQSLVVGNGGLSFVGPTALDYNWAYPMNGIKARRYKPTRVKAGRSLPLEAYRQGEIVNPVGISAITPIGFVLQKTGPMTRSWAEAAIDPHWRRFSDLAARCIRRDFPRVAADRLAGRPDAFAAFLDPSDPRNTMQLRLHAVRLQVDAMANDPAANGELLVDLLRETSAWLPKGDEQDADVLDLLGFLWRMTGYPDEAMALLERAVWAPGASIDHVVKLAVDIVATSDDPGGDPERALDIASAALADLLLSGTEPGEVTAPLRSRLLASDLPITRQALLLQRVASVLAGAGEQARAVATVNAAALSSMRL